MAASSKSKGDKPLSRWMMPRDIATHWNYTYEMLSFAYTYRDAYNELTGNRDMKMRKYEIEDVEWEIVKQLADVLKVSRLISSRKALLLCSRSSRMPPPSFLVRHLTLLRSYWLWITLTVTSRPLLAPIPTNRVFRLPLQWERSY